MARQLARGTGAFRELCVKLGAGRPTAMRCVPGPVLGMLLDRDGPLPVTGAVRIAAQVASARDAAHEPHLVRGEVKPGSILVATSDIGDDPYRAHLMDLGLAQPSRDASSTPAGRFAGTLDHVAPGAGRPSTGVASRG